MKKHFCSKKMAIVCLLVTAFILAQCVPVVLAFDNYEVGLVAHWRLDENYWNGTPLEVIDSSGNGNHGTAQNGVTTTEGLVGKCGDFDGINNRIVFSNDLNTRPTSQITLMAWINPEKVYTGGDWRYDDPIIGKRWSYYLYINHNGYLCFGFYKTRYTPTTAVVGPYLKPYEGNWIHVAATYDGSYTKVYLNGELEKQESRSGPINDDTTLPFISYIDYTRYFDGLIDEVMIYNRALPSTEINQYYQEIFAQNLGACPDQTINEGETVTFEATKIQPNPSAGLIFSWDFNNDGIYDYEENPSYAPDGFYDGKTEKVYPNEGTFVVNLKISDTNGVLKTDDCVVTVNNVAPQTTILSGLGIADNYIFVTQYSDSVSYFIDVFDDGTFSTPEYVDNKADRTYGAGIGDFDNDGDLDALVGDRYDTWYYEKTGDGNSFAPAVSIDSKDYNHRMDFAEADFDNDGNLDAIMTTYSNYEYTLYKGNGDGTFTITRFSAPSGNVGMDAADFNNDGNMDFVAAGWSGTRSINVYLGNGDGTFQVPTAIVSYVQSWGVSAADFNNDGNVDIIYGLSPKFYSGNGDGTFASGINLGINSVYAMAESDIDGDGNIDFVYTDGSTSVKCARGDGAGTFSMMDYVFVPISGIRGVATFPETGGILEVNEGENVDFEGTFSDAGWLDTHTATWDWGDTSPIETGTVTEENTEPLSTGSVTGSHVYGDNGEYTITLTVTDDYGDNGVDTAQIIVLNVAPTVNPGDDITTHEGTQIEFDGSDSYDPGYLDILTFEWDFGDLTTATGETPMHIYENEGTYTVTLTVTDDDGESDTETSVVTVLDATPSAEFDWTPETQDEGYPVQFADKTTSYDSLVSWSWDFAGIGTSTEANPEFTFQDDGTYTVTLTVTDDDGSTNQISYTVTVLDLAPTAEFSWAPEPQDEGSAIQFTDESTSAPDEIVAWAWDFAGIGTSTEANPEFTFQDDGTYTVTLTVTDDDGSTKIISNLVTVNNVAPVVEAGEDQTVDEGDLVSFVGSFFDVGLADTHTLVWDFGDGSIASGTLTPTHTYGDNGVYKVTLTVEDDDGAVTTDTLTVSVTNVVPILSEITATLDPVEVNVGISASATFTDAGILDTHTAIWDWGDETTSVGLVTEEDGAGEIFGNHAYESAGIYTLTLTLTDDDGASVSDDFRYIVVYDPSAGFVTGGGWVMSPEGAYLEDPMLTGKVTFGFVAKYKKGASVPTGNTEFVLHDAGLKFHSTSYDWLVTAGNTAKYKGTGTIKGMDGEYAFMVTVTEGDSKDTPDLFRIKIWDKSTGQVIYDNKIDYDDDSYNGTELEGGTIKIHKPKVEQFKVKENKAEKFKAKK